MTERIPQSTAKLVVFKAYLSSDHVTEATGKTIAITISKNGATSFSNPAAGATNATEMASGWYKVSLGTGDIDTLGPLAVRGAVATIDDVGVLLEVVSASTGGLTNLDAAITSRMATYTQPTGFLAATFPGTVASTTNITAGTITTVTTVTGLTASNLDTAISSRASQTSVDDLPTNAELATALGTADDAVLTAINDLPTNAELATALGTADDAVLTAIGDLPTNAELATALGTADDAVLAQIALVKAVTDKIDDTLEDDGGTFRFTANSLEEAPTGGSAPTASEVADEVQTRTLAAVTVVNGLAANSVTAAALAADAGTEIGTAVWATPTRLLTAGTNIALAKGTGVTGFNDPSASETADEIELRTIKANIKFVNDVEVVGNGLSPKWGPA